MTEQRTLVVSQYFPPESLGGAHRWKQLIQCFPDNHEARVLCPPASFPYGEFERSSRLIKRDRIDGVPVTRLWTYQPKQDSTSAESNLGRVLNYVLFSIFASIYVLLTSWNYDNIVTVSAPHTTFLPGVVGGSVGLRWYPDIYDLWLDNAEDMGYVTPGTLRYRIITTIERYAISRSERVFVITETMAQYYAEKHDVNRDRFTLVPFGVDADMFAPQVDESRSDTVVYTGNMGEAHALRPFMAAFEHLDGVAELELFGTGKRRGELEEFCTQAGLDDRVTFRGVVPREEIPEILGNAAASLVPLKQIHRLDYARPNKLLESMAMGTPYIASSLQEIDRVTSEANAGYAVDNKPEAVANAIKKLVSEREFAKEMGQNGAAYIEEEHRWPLLANRIIEIFDEDRKPDPAFAEQRRE